MIFASGKKCITELPTGARRFSRGGENIPFGRDSTVRMREIEEEEGKRYNVSVSGESPIEDLRFREGHNITCVGAVPGELQLLPIACRCKYMYLCTLLVAL